MSGLVTIPPMTLDIDHLRHWIGRRETRQDQATRVPVQALAATLDRDDPGDPGSPVPPLSTCR